MQQNSKEWHDLRSVSIGASDCPIIMGAVPRDWGTPYELWEQKVGLRGPKAMNPAMQRGKDNEKIALALVEDRMGIPLVDDVLVNRKRRWQIASLDGWNDEKCVAVEIKCLGKKGWDDVNNGIIPIYYQWQMQHQMAVADLSEVHYAVYHEGQVEILVCERNAVMIDQLIEAEEAFYECMMSGNPPAMSEKDYIDLSTDIACCEYELSLYLILDQIQALEGRAERIKEAMKKLSEGKNFIGKLFRCTNSVVRGRIDYDKIPELNNVDLEKYRAESTQRTTITRLK